MGGKQTHKGFFLQHAVVLCEEHVVLDFLGSS